MTSWEERMSAKAKKRIAAEEAEWRRQWQAEEAERDRLAWIASKPLFDEGPPCHACYEWTGWHSSDARSYAWIHIRIEDGDHLCRHECHGDDPPWCGLIGMAGVQQSGDVLIVKGPFAWDTSGEAHEVQWWR